MTDSKQAENANDKPPLFRTWRMAYWFVAIFFILEIALFYLFTVIHS